MSSEVSALREQGRNEVLKLNWPTRAHESWKYTNLKDLQQESWQPTSTNLISKDELKSLTHGCDFSYLVWINGQWNQQLSDSLLPGTELIESGKSFGGTNQFFLSLQKAYFQKSYRLKIDRNIKLEKPLCLLFVGVGEEANPASLVQTQLSVEIGSGSKVQILQKVLSLKKYNSSILTNTRTKFQVGNAAFLEFLQVSEGIGNYYSIDHTEMYLDEAATVNSVNMSLGGALCRRELEVYLEKPSAFVDLKGLFFAKESEHSDQQTNIEHRSGGCTSQQLYKGIFAGNGQGVFNGRVYIAPQSQKASSEQLNKNLLLSRQASVNSKPQLEIEADDVKATHGSTTGQISAEEVFYLRSRGISETKAHELLTYGFAGEVIENLSFELKSVAHQILQKTLKGISL